MKVLWDMTIKRAIKDWRINAIRNGSKEFDELKKRMVEIEALAKTRPLTEAEKARATSMDLKQRAKIKWEVDGDENTRFFHGYVNNRNRKNHIHGIMANGSWTTDPI